MTNKEIKISYMEYDSIEQMNPEDREPSGQSHDEDSSSSRPGGEIVRQSGNSLRSMQAGNGTVSDKGRTQYGNHTCRREENMEIRKSG